MANSILTRLARFFKASAHDALDTIENPGANARQMVRELSQAIDRTEEACASIVGDQKGIKRKRDTAQADAAHWNDKAAQAVKAERDDLAKSALQRAAKAERTLTAYDKALATLAPRVEELQSKLQELREQHDNAETEVELLDARAKAANASSKASRILGGVGVNAIDLDDVRTRVDQLEAHSEALAEVAADKNGSDLESQFAALGNTSVDDRLAALKARVNDQSEGV